MNINNLIIWFVFLSCGLTIIRTGSTSDRKGWAIVAAAILVVTVVLLYFAPKWASPISGSLWLILIVFPTVLLQWVNRLVYQQSYRKARMLAECVRWLHPADGLDRYPKLLYSLEMAQNGNMEAAREILSQHQDLKTPEGRYAAMMLYRMDCQWDELLTWIRDRFPEKVLHKDPNLLMNYLRALGETGDLNSLVKELGKFEQSADKNKDPMNLNAIRMTVLAFCGEVTFVKALFSNQLKVYSQEISNFWIATAEMAAGMEAEAKEKLMALNRSTDISMQKAISWRLSHGSLSDRTLTDESKQILAQLETDLQHEESYGGAIKRTGKRVHATYVLIGLNLLAFALEIGLGGNQYIENISRFGLWPPAVWQGEWWRLLSAMFLHVNLIHLALNMFGLYVLGEFVEVTLGIRKYLIAYFFSGLGSMMTIVILSMKFNYPINLTVGASGAIMGIIGATSAILLKGWLREKSRVAAKSLRSVLFIIGIQIIFDLSTPQISSIGHASGLVLGFLVSLFLVPNPTTKAT